jgi:(1->4)-alpha-D-glucan 1-alpha-D-glucosylmutase
MDPDSPAGRPPVSTYRVQFNQHFTFRDARELLPYLQDLGITDVYASPYLQARSGSLHGYDISSHARLNPEVGTPEEHEELTSEIRRRGMGHVLDIVPNHMGIGEPANEWWMNVLENGPSSPYAPYFDIEWKPRQPHLRGKVLLAVLGDQFGRVLERGELVLRFDDGRFEISYHEHLFPVSPKSSSLVLRRTLAEMSEGEHRLELESIVTALEKLPNRDRTDEASVAERHRENHVTRRRLRALHAASEDFRSALANAIEELNGRVGEPRSFDRLERLLDDQAYRLAFWRVAAEEINYRRFFDINDLAGLRVERGEVFQDTHRLILQLVKEGRVTGLRIDHPDGLYDPEGYLRMLRHECEGRVGSPPYIVVEKILTGDEELPGSWPVAGTVGYEFMNRVNGLFVRSSAEAAMDAVYGGFIGGSPNFQKLVYDRKKLILRVALASELNVLAQLLDRLSDQHRCYRDFTLGALAHALRETIACFPVYRTYIDAEAGRISETDRAHVKRATREAMRRNPTTSRLVYEFLRDMLLLEWPDLIDESARRDHARFVMKFQQLTGAVMAKGVEDTAFYIYHRLVSLNEVGGEPERFGIEPDELHAWLAHRRASWPTAMNAGSTHDTKRSEDVRARINALSEMPERWGSRVRYWAELNAKWKVVENGDTMPDSNDEYLLYQTLVGVWPLETPEGEEYGALVQRVQSYMEKAAREAKVHTSWVNANEEYDDALRNFVGRILQRGDDGRFLDDFLTFQAGIARIGMLNSLSQTVLKLTAPGVADIYQGQETWDFSLVDPDNRRQVDYDRRRELLAGLPHASAGAEPGSLARELLDCWKDGRIKLHVVRTLLHLRRESPDLFLAGEYEPLPARGPLAEHVFAFALRRGDSAAIVAVPRLWGTLLAEAETALPGPGAWQGTELVAPAALAGRYRELLAGAPVNLTAVADTVVVPLADVLAHFPVAVLERGAAP